jgi:anti-sigma B factor antagonist
MITMNSSVHVIEPSGILDSTKGEEFRQQVDSALATGADILLIDLKDVTFVDSSGLGALVSVLKKVRSVDRQMHVCSINAQIRMLFELTSMDRIFSIFDDRQQFESRH